MIVCIIVLCNSLTIVPVEHTGVILHFGATTSKTLGDGWHFKIPFVESVVDISNKVMKSDVSANSTSKDLQAITCNISINYHLAAAAAEKTIAAEAGAEVILIQALGIAGFIFIQFIL